MKPTEFPEQTTILAKDQPQYLPLPVHQTDSSDGATTSCWHLSIGERLTLLFTGRIYLTQLTFQMSVQPVRLATKFKGE